MSLAEALLDLQKLTRTFAKVPLRPRAEGGVLKAVANVNDAIARVRPRRRGRSA